MIFKKPNANQTFTISAAPAWPSIVFETSAAGAHTWTWTITWGAFTKTGKTTTTGNSWDAKPLITNFGGTLTVRAEANKVFEGLKGSPRRSNRFGGSSFAAAA